MWIHEKKLNSLPIECFNLKVHDSRHLCPCNENPTYDTSESDNVEKDQKNQVIGACFWCVEDKLKNIFELCQSVVISFDNSFSFTRDFLCLILSCFVKPFSLRISVTVDTLSLDDWDDLNFMMIINETKLFFSFKRFTHAGFGEILNFSQHFRNVISHEEFTRNVEEFDLCFANYLFKAKFKSDKKIFRKVLIKNRNIKKARISGRKMFFSDKNWLEMGHLIHTEGIVNGDWYTSRNKTIHQNVRNICYLFLLEAKFGKPNNVYRNIGKDVMVLILKMIYDSRFDVKDWLKCSPFFNQHQVNKNLSNYLDTFKGKTSFVGNFVDFLFFK